MCGIVGAFYFSQNSINLRNQVLDMSRKIRHRGPDWSGIYSSENTILAHERLGIVDPSSGKQPIFSADRKRILAANGEIYNHREIRKELSENYSFQTGSDCEVILALYEEKGIHFLNDLNGIFAFALYDEEKENYLIARDHMGIIPLYMGWDKNQVFYIASELKALEGVCEQIKLFPPGHYLTNNDLKPVKWYNPRWVDYRFVSEKERKFLKIYVFK